MVLFVTHLVMMIFSAVLPIIPQCMASYGLDIKRFHGLPMHSLSGNCDLDLWPSDIFSVCDTLSCHDNHLCQIIYKSHHAWQLWVWHKQVSLSLCPKLRADCNLWPGDMLLTCDTSSCHDDHLCKIIFKAHHTWQSYWLDTNKFHWSLCTKFKCKLWPLSSKWDTKVSVKPIHKVKVLTVTLTFHPATWYLFPTHRTVMMITCAKLFFNPTMQDEVMDRTRFLNTQTKTHPNTHTQTG